MPNIGSDGGIGAGLGAYAGIKGALGESSVRENWQHSPKTKFLLPLLQTIGLGTCLFVCCLCIALAIYCLVAVRGKPELLVIGLAFSACFFAAFAVGAWNLYMELTQTYWRQSPAEQMVLPAMADYYEALAESIRSKNQGGGLVRFSAHTEKQLRALITTNQDEGENEGVPDDVADLVDFIILSKTYGLSRPKWLPANGNRVTLPTTKHIVRKGLYDAMIQGLIDWGWVDKGSDGVATNWKKGISPVVALKTLGKGIYTK